MVFLMHNYRLSRGCNIGLNTEYMQVRLPVETRWAHLMSTVDPNHRVLPSQPLDKSRRFL